MKNKNAWIIGGLLVAGFILWKKSKEKDKEKSILPMRTMTVTNDNTGLPLSPAASSGLKPGAPIDTSN
jgi:hypothetical protein